ncbi:hypothetical protein BX666DRAFT_1959336 [Dichotomocladium elegans]|nr:hypothetical protein BX666DRAFT_1959336 [Dichotomocladium elegans]
MGFCNRCGEIASSGKCRKCGGREVAAMVETMHSSLMDANLLRWPIRPGDGQKPAPSRTASTPVVSSIPGPENNPVRRPPLLTKGSIRNSSFFLHGPGTNASMVSGRTSSNITPKHIPILGPQFFRRPSTSTLNSPTVSTPSSPLSPAKWSAGASSPIDMPVRTKQLCEKCKESMKGSRKIRVPAATTDGMPMWYHYDCLKCPVCSQHFTEKDYFVRRDKDIYHPKCLPECSACHKHIVDGSWLEQDLQKYHMQCAFRCTQCSKVEAGPKRLYCGTCASSPPARRRCLSSNAVLMEPSKPSDIFKSRTRALPPLGGSKICPRCRKSVGIMDETLGPLALSWHRKCLACAQCSKRMDSDARTFKGENDEWLVYCRSCLNNGGSRPHYVR